MRARKRVQHPLGGARRVQQLDDLVAPAEQLHGEEGEAHRHQSTRASLPLDAVVEAVADQQRADQRRAGVDERRARPTQHERPAEAPARAGAGWTAVLGGGLDEVDVRIAAQRRQRGDLRQQLGRRRDQPGARATPIAAACRRRPCRRTSRQLDVRRASSSPSSPERGQARGSTCRRAPASASVGVELGPGQQLAVQRRRVPQLGVRALGDDAAAVEHDDPVGQAQRRRAVGDQHGRPRRRARRASEAWMRLLGAGVDRRRGVVEDEHLRVGERGAGEGDALALPARQREAALADDGVVAVRQLEDEVVGLGDAGRGLDLGVGGVGPGEGDVLADRRREQEALLEHDVDRRAQRRRACSSRTSVPSRRTVPDWSGRRSGRSGRPASSCPSPTRRRARCARRAGCAARCRAASAAASP